MIERSSYFIVNRIKLGDSNAFRDLFRMHYPSLLSFVNGFVKDTDIAEDIVQNVFIRVWVYRTSLDVTKPMRGYLFLLCRREICNWFRHEVIVQRFVSDYDVEQINAFFSDSIDKIEVEEMKKVADEIVDSMPAKRREVFILSRREGLSIDDIAAKLDISPRTVNKHMQLALQQMRKYLKKNEK